MFILYIMYFLGFFLGIKKKFKSNEEMKNYFIKKIKNEESTEKIDFIIDNFNILYNYSLINDMSRLFQDCTNLKRVPDLKTSKVNNMYYVSRM